MLRLYEASSTFMRKVQMANPEHLAILKKGVLAWNKWRENNSHIRPNLVGIELGRKDGLERVNLSGANFSRADLTEADLENAYLYDVDFSNATLTQSTLANTWLKRASFVEATLVRTNLSGADLSESVFRLANLSNANLFRTELNHSILKGTNFSGCKIAHATFGDVNLDESQGLQDVLHLMPSSIGVDTIFKSKGRIPRSFLRGVGLSDSFVDYVESLVGKPIEYYSCFISYSSRNQDFADRLYPDLQNNNVRCWLATEDLKIGDKFRTRIEESIRMHDKLLLILSETSVASPWVESEVESAMERERRDPEKKTVLFPVMIDDAINDTNVAWASDIRRTRHIGDFCDWKNHDAYKKAFDRLLRDLKAESNK